MSRIQTLDDIFAELDAEAKAEHARFLADPVAQERITMEVEARIAAAAAEPDDLATEDGDEDDDCDDDGDEDCDDEPTD